MRTKEEFLKYAKQGHPKCPKDFYYVGKGNRFSTYFDTIWCKDMSSSSEEYNTNCYGYDVATDYFVPKKVWEEKFGPLEEKQITLSEIKAQYEAAKLLVGKKVRDTDTGEIFTPINIELWMDSDKVGEGTLTEEIFNKKGFVIILVAPDNCKFISYPSNCLEEAKEIRVKNTSGVEYIAEDKGEYWQFGCAKIGKGLIKEAHNLFEKFGSMSEYKMPQSIQIGAGIFTREILKELVEAAK